MCRHLGYLGPETDLRTLLLEQPHSLLRQSWAPADMRGGGTVNADGFGVGWYPVGSDEPARYRRAVPMWTDENFAGLASRLRSGAVLAAVRSATVGMPVIETACAPFTDGTWLFSHNGVVTGWPDSVLDLAAVVPARSLLTMDAPTDSAMLWAVLKHLLAQGVPPEKAVAELVADVLVLAPGSRLNLLLTDGRVLVGTAVSHSLSALVDDERALIASEPTGPGEWTPVPEGQLVVARPGSLEIVPLTDGET